jgi:hypothetical protein
MTQTFALDQVVLAPPIVMVVISIIIPVVVGLISKASLPGAVKAAILLALNALNALIVTAITIDGSAVLTKEAFINFVFGVVVSVASYFGVYRPARITSHGVLGPTVGIGPKTP